MRQLEKSSKNRWLQTERERRDERERLEERERERPLLTGSHGPTTSSCAHSGYLYMSVAPEFRSEPLGLQTHPHHKILLPDNHLSHAPMTVTISGKNLDDQPFIYSLPLLLTDTKCRHDGHNRIKKLFTSRARSWTSLFCYKCICTNWIRVYAGILKLNLIPFKTSLRTFPYILRPHRHLRF